MDFDPATVVGAWLLVSFTVTDAHGVTVPRLGDGAKGLLVYTPEGQMSAQVAGPDGYIGYAGTYRWEGSRVLHRTILGSAADWSGVDLPRTAGMIGELLVLSSLPADGEPVLTATWRRAGSPAGGGA